MLRRPPTAPPPVAPPTVRPPATQVIPQVPPAIASPAGPFTPPWLFERFREINGALATLVHGAATAQSNVATCNAEINNLSTTVTNLTSTVNNLESNANAAWDYQHVLFVAPGATDEGANGTYAKPFGSLQAAADAIAAADYGPLWHVVVSPGKLPDLEVTFTTCRVAIHAAGVALGGALRFVVESVGAGQELPTLVIDGGKLVHAPALLTEAPPAPPVPGAPASGEPLGGFRVTSRDGKAAILVAVPAGHGTPVKVIVGISGVVTRGGICWSLTGLDGEGAAGSFATNHPVWTLRDVVCLPTAHELGTCTEAWGEPYAYGTLWDAERVWFTNGPVRVNRYARSSRCYYAHDVEVGAAANDTHFGVHCDDVFFAGVELTGPQGAFRVNPATRQSLDEQNLTLSPAANVVEDYFPTSGGEAETSTLYVAANGDDTLGDGSRANPYRQVQKAFDVWFPSGRPIDLVDAQALRRVRVVGVGDYDGFVVPTCRVEVVADPGVRFALPGISWALRNADRFGNGFSPLLHVGVDRATGAYNALNSAGLARDNLVRIAGLIIITNTGDHITGAGADLSLVGVSTEGSAIVDGGAQYSVGRLTAVDCVQGETGLPKFVMAARNTQLVAQCYVGSFGNCDGLFVGTNILRQMLAGMEDTATLTNCRFASSASVTFRGMGATTNFNVDSVTNWHLKNNGGTHSLTDGATIVVHHDEVA